MENTAREFNISTIYKVGDRFIYDGELYEVDKVSIENYVLPEHEIGCHKIPTFVVESNANKINRFTNKYPDNTPVYYKYYLNGYHFEQGDFIEKLGRIEDIEEKYKIDIKVLFKATENGIFVNDIIVYHLSGEVSENQKLDPKYLRINLWDECLEWNNIWNPEDAIHQYYFSDYGKTWALTKEELENHE